MIEFDEAYFTVESSEIEQEKRNSWKGAVGKQNVVNDGRINTVRRY